MVTATIWLSFAFALGFFARLIGLPPLVGYLAAGFLLSANGYESNKILNEVAHAGVLLLLFSVGLKLRLKSLVRAEVLAGSLIHMAVFVAVFFALLFQFATLSTQAALFMALALSFSSTVVAAKVLESKHELRAFHGRVAIGILIVQDIVAVIVLSAGGSNHLSPWSFLVLGIFLIRTLVHKLLDLSGHGELVVLYGLMLSLVIGGSSFEHLGLSSELGALLLGIILSDHKRASDLSNALWGLKELFLVGFFLEIGLLSHPTLQTLEHALWFNALLAFKALLFFFILLLFRLRARSSFLAALSLATYSEFGLIVASLGVRNGWLEQEWLVLLAVTVALSFAIAAPLNRHAHILHRFIGNFLQWFESSKRHPDDEPIKLGNSRIVIVGMGRVGVSAYDYLSARQQRVVGLDSDPAKIENHLKQGRRVLYADAEDSELWSNLNLDGVHAVLLTIPELSAKKIAIRGLRMAGYKGAINATVLFLEEIDALKNVGADFVHYYYDGVGSSFGERSLEILTGTASS
ncbi:MAG: cation:proton antiporter [Gammaproteobacteria bacterium]|nr:cation:proton antiporter [Gammaproteobacteria bacterium]